MQFAFAFGITLFDQRAAATCCGFTRVERFAWFGFRHASAGALSAYRSLVVSTARSAGTGTLGESRWRTARSRALSRRSARTTLRRTAGPVRLWRSSRTHSLRGAGARLSRTRRPRCRGRISLGCGRSTTRPRGARRGRAQRHAGSRHLGAEWACRPRRLSGCRSAGGRSSSWPWSCSARGSRNGVRCGRSSRTSRTRRRCCCRTSNHWRSPDRRDNAGPCGRNRCRRSRGSHLWRCRLGHGRCRSGLYDWSSRHFRRRLLRRCSFRYLLGFRCFFRCGHIAKMLANALRVHQVDRTRMRLLFGDASFWEVLDQDFRLDLEFSSQFINPNLIGICHSPLVSTATSYLGTAASCWCQ